MGIRLYTAVCCFLLSELALGQAASAPAGMSSYRFGIQGLILSSETTRDDTVVSQGSALYTRLDGAYVTSFYGTSLGAGVEMDKFGDAQQDTILDLTVDGGFMSWFFRLGFGLVNETHHESVVESRSGTMLSMALGHRAPVAGSKYFTTVSLLWRQRTMTKEAGRDLSSALVKTESMPMIGFGVAL